MSAQPRDRHGRTGYQFMRELFEWENCDECGKGARAHVAVPFMGGWFARCKDGAPIDAQKEG